ncbi:MAG: N-6 DNA methylase [Candidatus Humimicrobiia bacterium]
MVEMTNKNLFCERENLRNESDVEQFFVRMLLKDLGYKEMNIFTKHTFPYHSIGKEKKRRPHRPDYAIKINKIWSLIIEAKHPEKDIKPFVHEAQDYATIINRGYIGTNPIKYCLITNGIKTHLVLVDQTKPILELNFGDFTEDNKKYKKLKEYISYNSLKNIENVEDIFDFNIPEIDELKGIFQISHNIIWRKHKVAPKTAFYEFTKILFIKLNEDRIINDKIRKGERVTKKDFKFSLNYINQLKDRFDNPINELFKKYRDKLERDVISREKKRIFKKSEELNLKPSTIKEIVELIEHLNLSIVEEDWNGMVFETFLSAVIRGKELGQFFTPRTAVKFMVKMANLKIRYNTETEEYGPEVILDGCCGTGGFLIFALSDMFKKVDEISTDKRELKKKIREECVYGVDASEEDIVPIARMNMYLHGDGGSHIFMADTLDKELHAETGLSEERIDELMELKKKFDIGLKFDVVLTNPPFAMKYGRKDEDQERILKQYDIAYPKGRENSTEIRASLKSNVMFIERYYDLLKKGGKLLTVIDESVLNTDSNAPFRKYIREHFIIKAVISLPKNAFVNADTSVKTSILYLKKRRASQEEQPKVFMAISKNIGHNDAGRPTLELCDLWDILDEYKKFER